jgi:hypothetical protein
MADIDTVAAPLGAVQLSMQIMNHVGSQYLPSSAVPTGSGTVPAPFRTLSLDDLLSLVAKVGILSGTSAAYDRPSRAQDHVKRLKISEHLATITSCTNILNAAFGIISRWPESANSLFSSIADRNPSPISKHPIRRIFATEMGGLLLAPIRSLSGNDIDIISGALDNWLLQKRGIYLDGRRRVKVISDGELHIDIADAVRRLEGRPESPNMIYSWKSAGMVQMAGGKVLMSSVEKTLSAMKRLRASDVNDEISVLEWNDIGRMKYLRHLALIGIFSGKIRFRRHSGMNGLSEIHASRSDLLQFFARGAVVEKFERAVRKDLFYQLSKLRPLLAEVWPMAVVTDLSSCPEIRCKYVERQYYGRNFAKRVYSVADAGRLMIRMYGPPALL